MRTNEKHWCPVCDEGWAEEWPLEATVPQGWCCMECEAFWPGESPEIHDDNFMQLTEWLADE
jgi:hypothetical protein